MSNYKQISKYKSIFYLVVFLFALGFSYVGVRAASGIRYSEKSILVFTNTENYASNVDSGGNIRYRMTVSNPSTETKNIKLKFFVPKGFKFLRMINTNGNKAILTDGMKPPNDIGPGEIHWDYTAIAGESYISFDITAP